MGTGTRIGRARGLGSAKTGVHHWIVIRVTGVANMLLGFWLIASLAILPNYDMAAMTGWLAQPLVAVPMMLAIVSAFYHTRIGMQVIVEDYVQDAGLKFATMMALDFYSIGAAALAIFSVAKIAFAGGAA